MVMVKDVLLTIAAILALSDALSCWCPDEARSKCGKTAADCPGAVVPDVCDCCMECAKQLGEACGGEWGGMGICDEGLYCANSLAWNGGTCQEKGAGNCSEETEFMCATSSKCIEKSQVCDGMSDCDNREDEDARLCRANGCAGNLVFSECTNACPFVCGEHGSLTCTHNTYICLAGCQCPWFQWWHRDESHGSYCYQERECPNLPDPCDSNPCANGGTCVVPDDVIIPVGEYICLCPDDYDGPFCEEQAIKCGTLVAPKNGKFEFVGGVSPYLMFSNAEFSCDSGYQISKDQEYILTCFPTGEWSDDVPTCQPIQ